MERWFPLSWPVSNSRLNRTCWWNGLTGCTCILTGVKTWGVLFICRIQGEVLRTTWKKHRGSVKDSYCWPLRNNCAPSMQTLIQTDSALTRTYLDTHMLDRDWHRRLTKTNSVCVMMNEALGLARPETKPVGSSKNIQSSHTSWSLVLETHTCDRWIWLILKTPNVCTHTSI